LPESSLDEENEKVVSNSHGITKMKTKTSFFLLFIGAISIISVVIGQVFLPPRWSYIIYGILALIIGSVALTEEWKTGKRVRAVVFVIAIVVGGLLTTEGWNEWGNYSQKKALIVALAREWLLNEWYTLYEPMSFDANDPSIGKQHFMYPQFRTSAQNLILTSALFDLTNPKDNELLNAVIRYEESIESFNVLLAQMNDACLKFPENVKQQKRKEVYLGVRDNAPLHMSFNESHEALLKLLKKEYSWALKEAILLLNEKSQKELKEKYK
jgi:hypothetical protein